MSPTTAKRILEDEQTLTSFHQTLLKLAKEPASLPQTLIQVLSLLKDEDASIQELADILMRDPALTTKLLKITNSARYGSKCEVTTMSRAVMILGLKAVSALTLSAAMYDITGKWKVTIDRERFWRHSLQVAIASRLLAERVGYKSPEEAFVCGLLHDLGILLMEKSAPESFRHIWQQIETRDDLTEKEQVNWRNLHASVGRSFLENWNFPSLISQAVGEHHNVLIAGDTAEDTVVARIVALANLISPFAIVQSQRMLPSDNDTREALRVSLHIEGEMLKETVKTLMTQTLVEAEFLEMGIGTQEEYLMEANSVIYEEYSTAVDRLCSKGAGAEQGLDGEAIEKIREEAHKAMEQQYNDLRKVLGGKWDAEDVINLGQQADSPLSTRYIRIICNQYSAMENVLRETLEKMSVAS
jgi:HD-like signal output (HDOD) protein